MLREKIKPFIVMLLIFAFPALIPAQETVDGKNEIRRQNVEQQDMKFEGAVILRVTFLASGQVGEVEVVSGLNAELDQQAIEGARKIKFEPARKDGAPVSITKEVEYTFFAYYKENDPELKTNAEITKKPVPDYPKDKQFSGVSGKVYLKLNLRADKKIEVDEIKSDLPQEFKDKVREAALKINFKPAIAKNGRKVSQIKEIEYEFKPENE